MTNPESVRPIGLFDSGVGGLSVLEAIRRELPAEALVYIADSGYAPYGDRPEDFIRDRAHGIVRHLENLGAKLVVVACNTATAVAVESIRAKTPLPVVAIEPALKPAARHSRSGVVGVIATTQTLNAPRFRHLVAAYASEVEVVIQACPGLAEEVDQGHVSGPLVESRVAQYVRPIVERGADTLVLGCTHYAFLKPVIQAVAGPGVTLIDPVAAVAQQVRRQLTKRGALAPEGPRGGERFLTTGIPADVERVTCALLQRDVRVETLSP